VLTRALEYNCRYHSWTEDKKTEDEKNEDKKIEDEDIGVKIVVGDIDYTR